jgi:hypothetical protein
MEPPPKANSSAMLTDEQRMKLLPRPSYSPPERSFADQVLVAHRGVSLTALDRERVDAEAARATAILERWEAQERKYMAAEWVIVGQCQAQEFVERERNRKLENRQREAARRLRVLAGRLPATPPKPTTAQAA